MDLFLQTKAILHNIKGSYTARTKVICSLKSKWFIPQNERNLYPKPKWNILSNQRELFPYTKCIRTSNQRDLRSQTKWFLPPNPCWVSHSSHMTLNSDGSKNCEKRGGGRKTDVMCSILIRRKCTQRSMCVLHEKSVFLKKNLMAIGGGRPQTSPP